MGYPIFRQSQLGKNGWKIHERDDDHFFCTKGQTSVTRYTKNVNILKILKERAKLRTIKNVRSS